MSTPKLNDVYKEAYGWIIDYEGNLCGLVAGDMGYEHTDTSLVSLVIEGLERHSDEVSTKIHELVDACMRARAAERSGNNG